MPKFVDIESPYSASTEDELKRNIKYARACVRDSLLMGEVPYASHLFYTQTGILDDNVVEERERGIKAGKDIIETLNATTVVYTDLGISKGMELGVEMAKKSGRNIEYRNLGINWERAFLAHENTHSQNGVW